MKSLSASAMCLFVALLGCDSPSRTPSQSVTMGPTDISSPRYREVLKTVGTKEPTFEKATTAYSEWIHTLGLDADTEEALLENTISSDLAFASGAGGVLTPQEIMATCTDEPRFIQEGLLPFATAINGDLIVIDFHNGGSGFFSHDIYWDEEPSQLRTCYLFVEPDFITFLDNIATQCHRFIESDYREGEEDEYPIDYHTAVEFLEGRRL